ncbi:MAG: hypothetical protein QOE38_2582 [Thermoleophilaceae bacterium]|nr:hypothetical protein [Thermoleophilaceae bacterium]
MTATGPGDDDGEPRHTGALSDQQFERERQRAAFELQRQRIDPSAERRVATRARLTALIGWPLAVGLLAACLAAGLVVVKRTIPKLHHTRIGATRTPVPGARDVRLDAGKYVIYYEAGTTGGIGLARPRGVSVRIETPSPAPLPLPLPLPLHTYSGNFHTGSSKVDARAFLTVEIPRAGNYRIIATGRSSQPIVARSPRIVLGEPTGGKILQLVGAGVLALLAFIALCNLVPKWWGRGRLHG